MNLSNDKMPLPEDRVAEAEASFRADLESVIAVAEKLGAHCPTIEDLVETCKLALTSPSQNRFLLSLMLSKSVQQNVRR